MLNYVLHTDECKEPSDDEAQVEVIKAAGFQLQCGGIEVGLQLMGAAATEGLQGGPRPAVLDARGEWSSGNAFSEGCGLISESPAAPARPAEARNQPTMLPTYDLEQIRQSPDGGVFVSGNWSGLRPSSIN